MVLVADGEFLDTGRRDATDAGDEVVGAGEHAVAVFGRDVGQEALAPTGLRSTQYVILGELAGIDTSPPSLNQLAEVLVLDRSGLGHSLRPLEREGLIRLLKSSRDRRTMEVVLTEDGRRRFEQAFPLWQRARRSFAAVVGQSEADELRGRLLAIAHDESLA